MQQLATLPFAKHLLVAVATDGIPNNVDLDVLVKSVPHRRRSGVICDARPFFLMGHSPWFAIAHQLGLELRVHAPEPDETVAELNATTLVLALVKAMRQRRIDGALVLGYAVPTPLARAIRESGRHVTLGVRSPHVARALRIADAVVDLDALAANAEVAQ